MNKEELLKFGLYVFNNQEDKFNHWLSDINISMGGVIPNDIINTTEGRELILNCLYRIEYGIFC